MQLQARVVNILKQPAEEWPIIVQEPSDVAGLLREYAAPLAAISAICRVLGMSFAGVSVLGMTFQVGMTRTLSWAVVSWVMQLAGAYIGALVIEKLAPTFQSQGDTVQALKLVVYSYTAVWVAGVLNLVPALAPLVILAGIYSIYLFYLGLPIVMHTPSQQVIPYMVVSALAIIVISVVLGMITGAIAGTAMYGAGVF
jgi:hypothetical protein